MCEKERKSDERDAEMLARIARMDPKLKHVLSDLRSFEGREEGVEFRDPGRYLQDVIIYGTPDDVVGQLARLEEEIHLGYLLCAPLSREIFTLLTEKVLPKFL